MFCFKVDSYNILAFRHWGCSFYEEQLIPSECAVQFVCQSIKSHEAELNVLPQNCRTALNGPRVSHCGGGTSLLTALHDSDHLAFLRRIVHKCGPVLSPEYTLSKWLLSPASCLHMYTFVGIHKATQAYEKIHRGLQTARRRDKIY